MDTIKKKGKKRKERKGKEKKRKEKKRKEKKRKEKKRKEKKRKRYNYELYGIFNEPNIVNHLKPNDQFSGCAAPLTYRCCIFYLFNKYTY